MRKCTAARFAQPLDQRIAQLIAPAPRSAGESRLKRAHIDVGDPARRGAHHDHHPRQRGFGQADIEIGGLAFEGLEQHRLPLLPHFGRVVLARREDQAGDEAFERIAAHEQAEALPVAQVQDSCDGLQQLVLGRFEQLVARVVVEDVDELLLGVPAGRQSGAADHARSLVA